MKSQSSVGELYVRRSSSSDCEATTQETLIQRLECVWPSTKRGTSSSESTLRRTFRVGDTVRPVPRLRSHRGHVLLISLASATLPLHKDGIWGTEHWAWVFKFVKGVWMDCSQHQLNNMISSYLNCNGNRATQNVKNCTTRLAVGQAAILPCHARKQRDKGDARHPHQTTSLKKG